MKLNDVQKEFILNLLSLDNWCEPGHDRLKITHKSDGKFQISWRYMYKGGGALNTISTNSARLIMTAKEMAGAIAAIKRAVTESPIR